MARPSAYLRRTARERTSTAIGPVGGIEPRNAITNPDSSATSVIDDPCGGERMVQLRAVERDRPRDSEDLSRFREPAALLTGAHAGGPGRTEVGPAGLETAM